MELSLQDRHAPHSRCFGCGPENSKGLRIKSFVRGEEVVCELAVEPQHQAFEGFVAGGIVGAAFDCHCNWTAAHHLLLTSGQDRLPATVTAEYTIRFLRPTPARARLLLRAHVVSSSPRRATVDARLEADGEVTATFRGVFVAVAEDHPAYGRW